jgi:hypothetical protein
MNIYKKILFLCFFFSVSTSYSFLPLLLRRLTETQILHGIVNNGILGGVYYALCKFGELVEKKSNDFASQAKPWVAAPEILGQKPEVLEKYNLHKFDAGTMPISGTGAEVVPALRPNQDIYLIDNKILISHQLIFNMQLGEISKEALLAAIRFEYERKDNLLDQSEYASKSFLQGIMNFIALKHGTKYATRIIPPVIRSKFDISSKMEKIPYLGLTTILDFACKYCAGMWNFFETQIKRYNQSRREVDKSWDEQAKTNSNINLLVRGYLEYIKYQKKKLQK